MIFAFDDVSSAIVHATKGTSVMNDEDRTKNIGFAARDKRAEQRDVLRGAKLAQDQVQGQRGDETKRKRQKAQRDKGKA